MDTPPKPFEHLAELVEGPASLDQAVTLTQALKAVPDVQAWLRQERQRIVLELHAEGMSYTEMAPSLEVKPERVSGIARGHSRSGGGRPKAQQVHHLDGDPRNTDPANLGLRDQPDA